MDKQELIAGLNRVQAGLKELEDGLRADAKELEPKKREWRESDIGQIGSTFYLRLAGEWRQISKEGLAGWLRHHEAEERGIRFRFNLADLLAEGPVVMGMTEDVATHLSERGDAQHHFIGTCGVCASARDRVKAALARSREGAK